MNEFPRHWIVALFKRLSVMYGSKWTAMWADVPMDEVLDCWQQDLSGVNAEQLRKGLEYIKAHNAFPPTLPEFLSVCRQFKDKPQNHLYLAAPPSRMPPHIAAQLQDFVDGKKAGDSKDWARKILASPKDYPFISVAFANEALGLDGA